MDQETHGLIGQMIATMRQMIAAHPSLMGVEQSLRRLIRAHAAAAPAAPEQVSEVTPPQPDHSGYERQSEL